MIIFYTPSNNQIRAICSLDTSSLWPDYIRAILPPEFESLVSMDKAVVLDGDDIVGLEDRPRPILSADKVEVIANGSDIVTITANGLGDEDVVFAVGAQEDTVAAVGGSAQIQYTFEVVDLYTVACFSPSYGRSFITIEAKEQ